MTVDRFSDLMSHTRVYNKRLLCKTFVQAHSQFLIALNQIWGSNFKSLNASRSHSKHFESLGLAILKVKMSRARKENRLSRRLAKSRIYHSPPL